jgi:hypothetical protein
VKDIGPGMHVRTMNYPVVGEIWKIFEQTLLISAKKLSDDIAKHQGGDSKLLWNEIKKQIKIGIMDIDIPDTPTSCPCMAKEVKGVVYERCRVPCLLGYAACTDHMSGGNSTRDPTCNQPSQPNQVKRVMDFKGVHYFIDKHGIAMDTYGIPKGVVEEEVLYLFTAV